ncbi:HelD family protein [Georgenia subflava]|uniref:AAA family ATPase n=1 Tax=Georgenia subflava TaxID=1622177 RepID=A0A6N7EH89_9MICO|nr:ATP-binding domain-containing protein [Georgenia subflava]MPV36348.1 AAA family ATPase [Georgenia subflava]
MNEEIDREQDHLDGLYARVDELRREVADRLDAALAPAGRRGQDLVERDAQVTRLTARRTALDHAEEGLCFGRVDRTDGSHLYVGRLGLRSAPPERAPLLLDWRAPGARPFYTATAASNQGVLRRRHLRTQGRRVVGLNDELLDLDTDRGGDGLVGEGALMESLTAHRTGRMHDIVATLQAEQDEIVRDRPDGVLVVQGGPGTGKTAVALHRAAYLLYSHPTIAERGVLVVGPSETFLRYIGQVLPSLGETHVVLTTADGLFPGVVADRTDTDAVARLKGDARTAAVLALAVRARQGAPGAVEVSFEGDTYRLDADRLGAIVERARANGLPHNLARRTFRRELLGALVQDVVEHDRRLLVDVEEGLDEDLARFDASLARTLDSVPATVGGTGTEVDGAVAPHELDRVRRELLLDPGVARVVEELWPLLAPEQLVEDLLTDPERLAAAAPGLADADRRSLLRERNAGWSSADVPLLDEAAELLGEDNTEQRARERQRRREAVAYARQVLGATTTDLVEEFLPAVEAEDLAERHRDRDHRTLAERAAADRTWAYGHVIVDEAQELSPMAWRAVLRRCPAVSLTVVGDVHQTSGAAGTDSWETVFGDDRRWRRRELSVNYRTPSEVMAAAAPVLAALDADARPPQSVRSTGERPWRRRVGEEGLAGAVVAAVHEELRALDGGKLAVVAPVVRVAALARALDLAAPAGKVDLDADVVVMTPEQAKGLEFDGVVVVDPDAILAGSRGLNALYVALTRPTRRLGVLHLGTAPAVLADVPEV